MKFAISFIILCVIIAVKPNSISKPQIPTISKISNKFNVPVNPTTFSQKTATQNELLRQQLQVKSIKHQRKPLAQVDPAEVIEIGTLTNQEIEETTIQIEDTNESKENEAAEENDHETPTVITGKLYELNLTIEYPWSKDLTIKNSEKFNTLSQKLDLELTSLIDNEKSKEFMPRGSFKLLNVLPSTLDNHLFINIAFEVPEKITNEEIYEMIELRSLVHSKLYEVGLKMLGMSQREIKVEELQKYDNHVECENFNLCRLTAQGIETIQSSSNEVTNEQVTINNLESNEIEGTCSPKDTIHRSGTSIYIFDNQKCVNQIKNGKFTNECSKKTSREVKREENFDYDMNAAPSDHHEQVFHSTGDNEETIIVVRKKGNKVFIEM
ncbi:hypothetical protein PVAND_015412 [Polypedilum vanderplanki]|uniref:Uncharacterized protein n=1 Tax=Polypedilum vanderplanki TaxID=319348 RepID=A0A9J6BCY3_POLVA|nr:hypothetical protein PVAND_015412 [Polypedilum vanderplanki]